MKKLLFLFVVATTLIGAGCVSKNVGISEPTSFKLPPSAPVTVNKTYTFQKLTIFRGNKQIVPNTIYEHLLTPEQQKNDDLIFFKGVDFEVDNKVYLYFDLVDSSGKQNNLPKKFFVINKENDTFEIKEDTYLNRQKIEGTPFPLNKTFSQILLFIKKDEKIAVETYDFATGKAELITLIHPDFTAGFYDVDLEPSVYDIEASDEKTIIITPRRKE